MSKILSIAWKDTQLRFASRSEILFFLLLPILFTVLVGQFSGEQSDVDRREVVLVVNQDGSALATDLIDTINRSTTIRAEVLAAGEAARRFDDRDAPALVTIPAGFEATLRSGQPVELAMETDATNLNALVVEQGVRAAAGVVGRPLAAALLSVDQAEQVRPFTGDAERIAFFDSSLAAARDLTAIAPVRVETTSAVETDNSSFNGYAFASSGQLIIWTLIPLLGTSVLFAFERETGTLQRLLTT
ncbi:MAG: ABC transporter permease, partial [Anaerolineae bacterium]|nr:ABC transporter permease [Anaerolineae bacterium]